MRLSLAPRNGAADGKKEPKMNTNTTTTTSRQSFDAAYTLLRKLQKQGMTYPTHAECVAMVYCPRGIIWKNTGGYISYEDAVTLGAYGIWRDEDNVQSTGYEARWPQHWFEDEQGFLAGDKFDPQ